MGDNSFFRITGKKGFHITFNNGWKISVQFGPGNYCDNYDCRIGIDDEKAGREGSSDAECAIFNNKNIMIKPKRLNWDDTVKGYMKSNEILKLMNWISKQKSV